MDPVSVQAADLPALSVRRLLRQASGLSVASLLASAVSIPSSFLAARWLGPTDFGRAQVVVLAYMLAALLRTGAFEGGVRAFVHHTARSERELALRAQNVAISFETLFSSLPGFVMLAAGLLVHDSVLRIGLFLGPVTVVVASFSSYYAGMYSARGRFDLVTRANLLRGVLAPLLVVVGIHPLGPAALFVAPALADLCTLAYLTTLRPGLGLQLDLDAVAARPLMRTGFPLGAIAVVYWGYRLVGTTTMALGASTAVYGVFAFAAAPVNLLARAISGIHAVLMPAVWSELAKPETDDRWAFQAHRITMVLALLAGVVTSLAQVGFRAVVPLVLPRFEAAPGIFSILSLNILLLSVAAVPALVLDSALVNRQVRHLLVWLSALVVNVVANVVVLRAGGGARGVAVNDVWVQAVLVVVIFAMAWGHLGPARVKRLTAAMLIGILFVTIVLCRLGALVASPSTLSMVWVLDVTVRCAVVSIAWVAVAAVSYRSSLRCASSESVGGGPGLDAETGSLR